MNKLSRYRAGVCLAINENVTSLSEGRRTGVIPSVITEVTVFDIVKLRPIITGLVPRAINSALPSKFANVYVHRSVNQISPIFARARCAIRVKPPKCNKSRGAKQFQEIVPGLCRSLQHKAQLRSIKMQPNRGLGPRHSVKERTGGPTKH